jgi:hypothetical protein
VVYMTRGEGEKSGRGVCVERRVGGECVWRERST